MRHHALLGSALRANACQFSKPHAQQCAALISFSKELSRTHPRRSYSSPSPKHRREHNATAASTAMATARSTTTTIPTPAITTHLHDVSPSTANPPPTARPPPLNLPIRPPDAPKPPTLSRQNLSHLFATGMAYVKFYKTGLRHIYTNTRLLYASPSSPSSSSSSSNTNTNHNPPPPAEGTRARLHLRLRWRHDVRRLPLFALVLLVCGEFTPLVVLALPGAVPLVCRIPRQVERLLRGVEARRDEGRRAFRSGVGVGEGEVPAEVMARVLGLRAGSWWTPPSVLASRVRERVRFLALDDALLVRSGGAAALVAEEVRLACTDRGIDVLGRGEEELRAALGRWLRLTDAGRLGEEGRERAVKRLLLLKDSEWAG